MDVIGFKICTEDLENQGNINYWSSKSYDKAENDIVDFYISATGGMPCKNMALTKKLSFRLPEGITIPELRNLGDKIHKNFGIECFQISIDRDTSMVNMLFDVVDIHIFFCQHWKDQKLNHSITEIFINNVLPFFWPIVFLFGWNGYSPPSQYVYYTFYLYIIIVQNGWIVNAKLKTV